MSANAALLALLLVVASALCGVGIWALVEWVKTARSLKQLAMDLDIRMVPLLDKADITVDAMNAELLRFDHIVTRIEEVTDRVSDTSRVVQEVANAPAEIVTDLAERVRKAWKTRKQSHHPMEDDSGIDDGSAETPRPDAGSHEAAPEEAD